MPVIPLSNGSLEYTSTNEGSTAFAVCDDKFHFFGKSSTATCQSSRKWEGLDGACKQVLYENLVNIYVCMCMSCVCVYICVYVYVYAHMCLFVYICACICAHACLSAYVYRYVHISVCAHVCVYMCLHVCIYIYIYVSTYVSVCLRICMCLHMCLFATYVYMCDTVKYRYRERYVTYAGVYLCAIVCI